MNNHSTENVLIATDQLPIRSGDEVGQLSRSFKSFMRRQRGLFFCSTAVALLIPLTMFGCIADDEPDRASTKSVAFSSEHARKVGDSKQENPLRAAPPRVWETAAGELIFDSGETFSTVTTQRQGLTDNNRLEGKAATTDKNKEIDPK